MIRTLHEGLLPSVDRLGADPQSLGHLTDRVTPILDLGHRIALELISEFSSGHLVLLASKITKQGVYKSTGYSGQGPAPRCPVWS